MYNPNYGSSSSSSYQQSTSVPYSSTPSNTRPQRPRLGYSGPAAYPRPRSSASKPNPECYSESRGQYGYAEDCLDNTGNKYPLTSDYGNVYSDEYRKSESYGNVYSDEYRKSENYGNVSESYMNTPRRYNLGNSDAYSESMRGTMDSMMNNYGNSLSEPRMDISLSSMHNSSQNSTAYFTCNESFYESPKKPLLLGNLPATPLQYSPSKFPLMNSGYNADNKSNFEGKFQNKKDKFKADSSLAKKLRGPKKKAMASKSEWRCAVCSIDFTSSIPYDMHLRGAKHAKKLKLKDALQSVQSQVAQSKEIAPVGKSFRCDLCNVTANSSLQLQTHLEGTKHKNKLTQLQQPKESTEKAAKAALEVNGKSNGAAVVRPLPAEFGEPQQTKMCKFSCDTCNLIVNSETQLQQHLASKKHQAKVEGKPYNKKKLKRKKDDEDEKAEQKMDDNETETSAAMETATQESATNDISEVKNETSNIGEARKMVVGVKTLSSCFVQGDTLQ